MKDIGGKVSSTGLGSRRVIGQVKLREALWKTVKDNRVSHAYLFSGPPGTGKKALALAFAEAVNGIDHLGDLGEAAFSRRKSWYYHPDIHLFFPMPSQVAKDEFKLRLEMLAADPYEIIDFALRPSLAGQDTGKNLRAFYSVEYFNSQIRKIAGLKTSEGRRTMIIITNVETMRAEVVNAFLKLLEEPGKNVTFLLTTDHIHSLLPTLISRCQTLNCRPLDPDDIYRALVFHDSVNEAEARFLSRVAGGNYSITRFYNPEKLQEHREDVIRFLRVSYRADPGDILEISQRWHSETNREQQFALLNMMETFLRDIALQSAGVDPSLITNIDRFEVIENFCSHLKKARIQEMLFALEEARSLLVHNIQPRILFTVLANRFAAWMRGLDPSVPSHETWRHVPAISSSKIT